MPWFSCLLILCALRILSVVAILFRALVWSLCSFMFVCLSLQCCTSCSGPVCAVYNLNQNIPYRVMGQAWG
ncbi:hypothetical protein QBC37DRAFT_426431, partial [Rhypophila decipiens]